MNEARFRQTLAMVVAMTTQNLMALGGKVGKATCSGTCAHGMLQENSIRGVTSAYKNGEDDDKALSLRKQGHESIPSPIRVGGLPEFSSADLEGTPCPAIPLASEVMHIVYAFQVENDDMAHQQLQLLAQSVWSLYSTGCGGDVHCQRRLLVHVFYDGLDAAAIDGALSAAVLRGLNVRLYPTQFENVVTDERKVWGYGTPDKTELDQSMIPKLSLAANYFRFYAANFLHTHFQAASFLYLDTDTVTIKAGFADLFQTNPPVASFGTTGAYDCRVGDMLLLDDARLSNLAVNPDDPCLVSAVMLVNVRLWIEQGITAKLESLLKSNKKKKMWHTGSLPPLMVALNAKWGPLNGVVVNGEDSNKEEKEDSNNCSSVYHGGLMVHPFKPLCPNMSPHAPKICGPSSQSFSNVVGSMRLMGMHMHAFAKLLNTSVVPHLDNTCVVAGACNKAPQHVDIPELFVFKPENSEKKDPGTRDWLVADNGHMDQVHRSHGRKTLRLHLVEDMRPSSSMRHIPRIQDLSSDSSALLCYHGNAMHFSELGRILQGIQGHVQLRAVLPVQELQWAQETLIEAGWEGHFEVIGYTANLVYEQLRHCDIGLAPTEVQPAGGVTEGQLAEQSAGLFVSKDSQEEDMVIRCKRTSNSGRMFVFMQLGVPTVTDACTDSVGFASYANTPTALVVNHADAWRDSIMWLLRNPALRVQLSNSSRTFAEQHLTTRRQASIMLNKLGCLARERPLAEVEAEYQ